MDGTGIKVRLGIEAASACPVAAVTAGGEGRVTAVEWTDSGDDVVEEFELTGDGGGDPADMQTVFETEDRKRYRFERAASSKCLCDRIEGHGTPVTDIAAEDGELSVSFYADDMDTVRAVLRDVRQRFEGVSIRRLTRTGATDEDDLTLVDRDQLTDRQREVLETALAMGYFSRPRDANATEVAETLDISPSTFAEHLAAAESKVFESLFRSS